MAQTLFYSTSAVSTTLGAGIASGDTTCTLSATTGLPASFPFKLLIDWGLSSQEVVYCTALAGTTATIQRGKDGSTAQSHAIGATVVHGVSAEEYNNANAHINASSGVHGLTGSVVGTSDTQTLTNKTLSGGTITGTITASGATFNSPTISSPTISGTVPAGSPLIGKNEVLSAQVVASEGTSNSGYVDLTTVGPSVTVTVGSSGSVLVILSSEGSGTGTGLMSVALSGANTVAAADGNSACINANSTIAGGAGIFVMSGLTAGSTTFKAQYRSTFAGTYTFTRRSLVVIPL